MKQIYKKLLAAALGVSMLLSMVGCGQSDTSEQTQAANENEAKVLTIVTAKELDSLTTLTMNKENNIACGLVYETLVAYEDGEIVPKLAEEWGWDETNTVLTFKLRQDVAFTDGAAFNAESVKEILDFDRSNPNFSGIKGIYNIESVEVVDEYTVAVHYAAPCFSYINDFCFQNVAGMMSPNVFEAENFQTFTDVVGTGPYIREEMISGDCTRFVRNENYWGEAPYYDEVVIKYNNVKMPKLGYGVFQVSNEECERCVLDAISVGYRAIDTAQSYGNEEAVGNAIQKCGVPREELFLTSKIWMSNASYEKAKASIDKSLHKLKTDYLDLMLIHQPFGDYYGAYRAMEEAYKEGKLRAIGVSNFYPDRLIDLCQFAEIAPMVNQVETHVFQQQRTAHEYMKKYGVQHEAWGPFAEGKKNCFTNPVLIEIGEKYGKTAAQTALRFLIQSDVVVIPKSTHKERMEQNLDVFDFSLSEADMEAIRTLDEGKSLFFDHYDPSTVEMLTNMGKTRIV